MARRPSFGGIFSIPGFCDKRMHRGDGHWPMVLERGATDLVLGEMVVVLSTVPPKKSTQYHAQILDHGPLRSSMYKGQKDLYNLCKISCKGITMLPVTGTRSSALVSMLHAEFPNYHPLLSIARIAHHQDADLKLQFECHKTIAKYLEPELKSVEVKGDMREEKVVRVSLFDVEDVEVRVQGETTMPSRETAVALANW